MNCPLCGQEARFDAETKRCSCPACGWGSSAPDAAGMRQVAEVLALGKEAGIVQLVGALCVSGGVVAIAAYIVFAVYGVRPSALNALLFVGGIAVYTLISWYVARAIEPRSFLGRVDIMLPRYAGGGRLFAIWLLLWPGRLAGMGAIGVYRFIKARRRLKELIGDGRRRFLQHQENVRR